MKHPLLPILMVFSGLFVTSNTIAQEAKAATPAKTGIIIVPKLAKALSSAILSEAETCADNLKSL